MLYWHKHTNTDLDELLTRTLTSRRTSRPEGASSVYVLYWYKSTNTDAASHEPRRAEEHRRRAAGADGSQQEAAGVSAGTRFTSFTGTKVQILTQLPQEWQNKAMAANALANQVALALQGQVNLRIIDMLLCLCVCVCVCVLGLCVLMLYILYMCNHTAVCVLILIVGEEQEYRHWQRVC